MPCGKILRAASFGPTGAMHADGHDIRATNGLADTAFYHANTGHRPFRTRIKMMLSAEPLGWRRRHAPNIRVLDDDY